MFVRNDIFTDGDGFNNNNNNNNGNRRRRGSSDTGRTSDNAGLSSADNDVRIQVESPTLKKKKLLERKKQMLLKRKQKLGGAGMLRTDKVPTSSGQRMNAPTSFRNDAGINSQSTSSNYSSSSSSSSSSNSFSRSNNNNNNNNNHDSYNHNNYNSNNSYNNMQNFNSQFNNSNSNYSSFNNTNDSHNNSQSGVQNLLREREQQNQYSRVSQVERDLLAQGIQPVFDPVKKMQHGVKLDFSDMKTFLSTPLPKGVTVQCYIIRNKKGLKNKMYPQYELYLEDEDKFLLAAKKRAGNKTSNYLISMEKKNLDRESASYLGKLRSNFIGSEFTIFDKGINPKSLTKDASSLSLMTVRQELGIVQYDTNILGNGGPRKMVAAIPRVRKDNTRAVFRSSDEESLITKQIKEKSFDDLVLLQNRTPKWNEQVRAYVLNFNGRVTMASVKNFQLIEKEEPDKVLLQFGRVGKDTFTMDLQYPFSPLQAFAMCLSSFDSKLSCQ